MTGGTPNEAASLTLAASSYGWYSQISLSFIDERLAEGTHVAELVVALLDARFDRKRLDFAESALDRRIEQPGSRLRIHMRAAERLGHDFVDGVELQQVRGGDLERFGRFDLAVRVAPENRRAPLGRDDAVDCKLLHQHAIANCDAEGAAAAPFTGNNHDDRRRQH